MVSFKVAGSITLLALAAFNLYTFTIAPNVNLPDIVSWVPMNYIFALGVFLLAFVFYFRRKK